MFDQKYLIRLDDACSTMDKAKWCRMEVLLDEFGVKPMVGVIPDCRDDKLKIICEDAKFWEDVLEWQRKGWSIAMHGYNHCYISDKGMHGLNPMWERSEFSGVSLEIQRNKIRIGIEILKSKRLCPQFFFAPSHTFDENTLIALKEESDIRVVSDTIGRYPYKYGDFYFLPQITGHCFKFPFGGIYTFCFHPNTMRESDFKALENFLKVNKNRFIGFGDIDLSKYGKKKLFDRFLSWTFFKYRKIRGNK